MLQGDQQGFGMLFEYTNCNPDTLRESADDGVQPVSCSRY